MLPIGQIHPQKAFRENRVSKIKAMKMVRLRSPVVQVNCRCVINDAMASSPPNGQYVSMLVMELPVMNR